MAAKNASTVHRLADAQSRLQLLAEGPDEEAAAEGVIKLLSSDVLMGL